LPATAEAMWALMQSTDLTAEQLAVMLEMASSASEYYSIMDRAARLAEQLAQDELDRIREAERLRQEAFDSEIDALIYIQDIAEGVVDMLSGLRDMIVADLSTGQENYQRSRLEAEGLAAALATMTDPDMINETIRRIEQLTRAAYGTLDDSQKMTMGRDFLDFLDQVQALALERLNLAAEDALANTGFTPEEIMTRFNELVTDPLILVVGLQETAALNLSAAAEALLDQVPSGFNLSADESGNPQISYAGPTADDIRAATEAGMKAGSQAMSDAAVDLAAAVVAAASSGRMSASEIAAAIASIPSRIDVTATVEMSEFS